MRTAFYAKVKAGHPDHGGSGVDMDLLTQAKETLLKSLTIPLKDDPARTVVVCVFCKGHGTVYNQGRMTRLECAFCHGTGES